MRRLFVIVVVLVLLLAGCSSDGLSLLETPAVSAVDVPTLPVFLDMLAGPTGWVILGALLSSLFAQWPWYNKQSDALKRGLVLGASIVPAIIARLLLTYVPASFWEQTAAYWYIIGGVVLTWLGSQGWFKGVVKPKQELERKAENAGK